LKKFTTKMKLMQCVIVLLGIAISAEGKNILRRLKYSVHFKKFDYVLVKGKGRSLTEKLNKC